MIKISEERYNDLLEYELMVKALEWAGVDNWEGYEEAMEVMEEMREESDD